jgi:hypothetical protein
MILIGDVHGNFRAYKRIIKSAPASIQVGDMGVGFIRIRAGIERSDRASDVQYLANPPHYAMLPGHRFIRGNHDNPRVCRRHSQWIPDGCVVGKVMFVGGAHSIDREFRTPGYNWWSEEQLSEEDFAQITEKYLRARPMAMITHDCPVAITPNPKYSCMRTRTNNSFQLMWEAHQPDLWVFGHHHVSFDQAANGTRFVCLAELEVREFDLPLETCELMPLRRNRRRFALAIYRSAALIQRLISFLVPPNIGLSA